MKWFLIAYLSSGLSVAVSPPLDSIGCKLEKEMRTYPAQKYTFKCERHKKRPMPTGVIDSETQESLEQPCSIAFGKACGMLEEDRRRGLPDGTTSMRFWKARESVK